MSNLNLSVGLPSKENIYQVSQDMVQKVLDGEINALEMAVKLSAMDAIIANIREGIAENVLAELDKEQGKTVVMGAKIQRKETGTTYDYSGTPIINELKAQEKTIADRRKAIEKASQLLPEGMQTQMIDEQTGEAFAITKAAKSSKTSFAVTLAQ
jgi:glycine betaine/choline ABC-type transport system substrate-binding protein